MTRGQDADVWCTLRVRTIHKCLGRNSEKIEIASLLNGKSGLIATNTRLSIESHIETSFWAALFLETINGFSYWPNVKWRWLDIGQVLYFGVFMDRNWRGPKARKYKKNEPSIQLSWPNNLQYRNYVTRKRERYFRTGHSGWSRTGKISPNGIKIWN